MHYLIIGNGVAGINAAFALRERHPPEHATITVISDEAPYFFSRTALMYAYMDRLQRPDLEPYERHVYQRQSIDLIQARVTDLDADAHQVTLDDGRSIDYDRCLIATGANPRMVDVPGLGDVQEGLVTFVSIQDLDHCERLTWDTEQAVVVGGGLIGIELAECFLHHGLDVTFLVREPYYWPAAFAPEEGRMISDHIRSHGVDLRHQEELQRIDVDDQGHVSAIHTSQGDRLPCQMLGISIGVTPAVQWLNTTTTPPATDLGLCVDASFETSLDDVFGAGDCVQIDLPDRDQPLHEPIWYAARLHGQLAARSMLGDPIHYDPPIFYNSAKFFDVEYTTVGDVKDLPSGTKTLFRRHPDKPISQRIVVNPDDQVIGFSMLGSNWDHTVLTRWVKERRSLSFVREHLRRAQFDHEFGRLDLSTLNEEEKIL